MCREAAIVGPGCTLYIHGAKPGEQFEIIFLLMTVPLHGAKLKKNDSLKYLKFWLLKYTVASYFK